MRNAMLETEAEAQAQAFFLVSPGFTLNPPEDFCIFDLGILYLETTAQNKAATTPVSHFRAVSCRVIFFTP